MFVIRVLLLFLFLIFAEKSLQAQQLYPVQQNGKWGYIDQTGKVVIPPQFEEVKCFCSGGWQNEGLIAAKVKGLWGYINVKGDIVIPPQFTQVLPFSQGLALVNLGGSFSAAISTKNGQWLYIDKQGKSVMRVKQLGPYMPSFWMGFSEGLALFLEGGTSFNPTFANAKYGFIDTSGEVVIPAQFDTAWPFKRGVALVTIKETTKNNPNIENTIIGLIDNTGKFLFKIKAESISYSILSSADGYSVIGVGGKNYIIDQAGRVEFETSSYINSFFSEGMLAVYDAGKCRYVGRNGKVIIESFFESCMDFEGGLATVQVDKKYDQETGEVLEDVWGSINTKGEWIIQPKFKESYIFSEGLATVQINEKWGYIDRTGKINIPIQFDKAGNFSGGLASVSLGKGIDAKSGYIDTKGRYVWIPTR